MSLEYIITNRSITHDETCRSDSNMSCDVKHDEDRALSAGMCSHMLL